MLTAFLELQAAIDRQFNRMKYWEIVADQRVKPDGLGAVSQPSIPAG